MTDTFRKKYHTLESGFACAKCGYNLVKDGGADSDTDCAHEPCGPYFNRNNNEIIERRCKHCGEFYR